MALHEPDNDALLLAYLAGELPEADRSRAEQRLETDTTFRSTFETLREAYAGVEAALRSADAAEPLTLSAAAAGRRFARQVEAWRARDAAAAAAATTFVEEPVYRRRLRIPNWAYPVATAATIVLAYAAWWAAYAPPGSRGWSDSRQNSPPPLRYPIPSRDPYSDPEAFAMGAWTQPNALIDDEDQDTEFVLGDTEDELYALSDRPADDGDVPTLLLLGEFE